MTDFTDLLAGSGGKTFKFETIGDTITGTVTDDASLSQVTDFETGKPDTWDDGQPKMQLRVNVQTQLRDPADPHDDGVRSVYVKWWGGQRKALQQALREAGARGIAAGTTFTATYVGDGEAPRRGFSAPKLYRYEVKPPASAPADLLGGSPAQQQPTQQQAPAQQQPVQQQMKPELAAAMAAMQAQQQASAPL